MSRYIKFDDAVKIMACEMYAEAQSQGYDVDGIEDFMPEAKAWITDAPSIDIVRCGECIFADEDAKAEMYRCLRASFPYWHTADHSCSDGFRDSEKPNN